MSRVNEGTNRENYSPVSTIGQRSLFQQEKLSESCIREPKRTARIRFVTDAMAIHIFDRVKNSNLQRQKLNA